MKVLIIPEDPKLDQYILRPVVERMMADLGVAARVEVLWDPRLRSVSQALDPATVRKIVAANRMVDLFLLMVDRDCESDRAARARTREDEHPGRLLATLAIEEVEVWMLALHRDVLPSAWQDIRRECHPKERFAHPLLASIFPRLAPGEGRRGGDAGPRQPMARRARDLSRAGGAEATDPRLDGKGELTGSSSEMVVSATARRDRVPRGHYSFTYPAADTSPPGPARRAAPWRCARTRTSRCGPCGSWSCRSCRRRRGRA